MKKGFPLLDNINNVILRIREGGLMTRWIYESQISIKKYKILEYEDSNDGTLDFKRISFAMIILGVGLVTALFTFISELLLKSYKAKTIFIDVPIP